MENKILNLLKKIIKEDEDTFIEVHLMMNMDGMTKMIDNIRVILTLILMKKNFLILIH